MNKISFTLFKISFACLVAVGSGFVALIPHLLNYEKSAYTALYQVEEKIGKIDDHENYDCDLLEKYKADCNISIHQVTTSENMVDLANCLVKFLLAVSFLGIFIGVIVFFSQNKVERERFFSNK